MVRLRDIQHNNLIRFLLEEYRKAGQPIDTDLLFNIQQSAARNTSSEKLYTPYDFPYNDRIDIESLNAAFKMLYLDYKTITDFHQDYIKDLRRLELTSKAYERMINRIGRKVLDNASAIIAGSIIDGISTYIKPSEVVDRNVTTMDFTDDVISLTTKSIIPIGFSFAEEDVSETVEAIGDFRTYRTGSKASLFNPINRNLYDVRIASQSAMLVSLRLEVQADFSEVNKVVLDSIQDPSSMMFAIDISTDGKTYDRVAYEQVKDMTYSVDFTPVSNAGFMRFTFYKQSGKTLANGNYEYAFIIRSISLFKGSYQTENPVFQTQKIKLDKKVRKVSIVSSESKPQETSIKYYITSNEKDGEPIGWTEIEPANRAKKSNNIIDLYPRLQVIRNIKPISDEWDLYRIRGTDIDLYNILQDSEGDMPTEVEIKDETSTEEPHKHVLSIPEEAGTIDESSVKLYRGIYDWAVLKNNRKRDIDSTIIEHFLESSESSLGYKPIDLYARIIDEKIKSSPSDPDSRTLELKYPVYYLDTIEIKEENGAEILSIPIEITGDRTVILDAPIDPLTTFYITYNTKVRDIETEDNSTIVVNPDTLIVSSNVYGLLKKGEDYTFGKDVNRIYLSARKYKGLTSLEISFIYSIYMEDDYPVYETSVFVEEDTDLEISKFSRKEIEAGNFHEIDGVDISDRDKYTMVKGWHKITTTQVFPNNPNNDNDYNPFTNEKSEAGVTIPEGVYYRAFKEPLRKVSRFMLGNNIKPKDHRSFAVSDNMILLNRNPDFIKEELLDATSGADQTTGSYLLAKKLTGEIPSPGVDYYEPFPERFDLEFSIIGTDDETNEDYYQSDYVYLKIEPKDIQSEGKKVAIRDLYLNNLGKGS